VTVPRFPSPKQIAFSSYPYPHKLGCVFLFSSLHKSVRRLRSPSRDEPYTPPDYLTRAIPPISPSGISSSPLCPPVPGHRNADLITCAFLRFFSGSPYPDSTRNYFDSTGQPFAPLVRQPARELRLSPFGFLYLSLFLPVFLSFRTPYPFVRTSLSGCLFLPTLVMTQGCPSPSGFLVGVLSSLSPPPSPFLKVNWRFPPL